MLLNCPPFPSRVDSAMSSANIPAATSAGRHRSLITPAFPDLSRSMLCCATYIVSLVISQRTLQQGKGREDVPISVCTIPGHIGNTTAVVRVHQPSATRKRSLPTTIHLEARTQPRILAVDLARHPVQRGLARAVRPAVDGHARDQLDAARPGADGDEPRRGARLQQRADGLEEHDGAEDVDLFHFVCDECLGRWRWKWGGWTHGEVLLVLVDGRFVCLSLIFRDG
jgi:hypothetical protein